MADHYQHGEGKHDQRVMTMTAAPASDLVVVEAQLSRFAPLAGTLATNAVDFTLSRAIRVKPNFPKLYFKQLNGGALVAFGETALEFLGGDIKYAER